jgi:hypothetical protein
LPGALEQDDERVRQIDQVAVGPRAGVPGGGDHPATRFDGFLEHRQLTAERVGGQEGDVEVAQHAESVQGTGWQGGHRLAAGRHRLGQDLRIPVLLVQVQEGDSQIGREGGRLVVGVGRGHRRPAELDALVQQVAVTGRSVPGLQHLAEPAEAEASVLVAVRDRCHRLPAQPFGVVQQFGSPHPLVLRHQGRHVVADVHGPVRTGGFHGGRSPAQEPD